MRSVLVLLYCVVGLLSLNAQVIPCTIPCKRITFDAISTGMLFYFPVHNSPSTDAIFSSRFKGPASYKDIAGKKYVVSNVSHFKNKLYYDRSGLDANGNATNDRVQLIYTIWFQNKTDTTDSFSYEVSIDATVFEQKSNYPPFQNNAFVQGAIAWDEFVATKEALMKCGTLYTLFEVQGKKSEKVNIVDVLAGSWETPLGVIYTADQVRFDTLYLNICGSNVPENYLTTFNFSKYFTDVNPQGEIPKARWELIRSGKPDTTMTEEEVLATLGKPKQVTRTIKNGIYKTTYFFSKYTVLFNNRLIEEIINIDSY